MRLKIKAADEAEFVTGVADKLTEWGWDVDREVTAGRGDEDGRKEWPEAADQDERRHEWRPTDQQQPRDRQPREPRQGEREGDER